MEFWATGTQPIAVALTNGNHDAADAIAPVYVTVTSSQLHAETAQTQWLAHAECNIVKLRLFRAGGWGLAV